MPTVTQIPGGLEPLQQGLAQLIQALQFKQQRAQQQQYIDLQQQQLEMQEISQRSLERERVTGRALQLVNLFGPSVMDDPSVQTLLEEGGVNPKSVMQQYKQNQQKLQQQTATQRKTAIKNAPAELQGGLQLFFETLDAGLGQEAATTAMQQSFEGEAAQLDPEKVSAVAQRFPALFAANSGLSVPEAMEAAAKISVQMVEQGIPNTAAYGRVIDQDIAQLRLQILQTQYPQLILEAGGQVSPSQRLSAALAFQRIISQDLQDNRISYSMRFGPEWLQLNTEQQLGKLYPGSPIPRAWKQLPRILAQHGLADLFAEPQP